MVLQVGYSVSRVQRYGFEIRGLGPSLDFCRVLFLGLCDAAGVKGLRVNFRIQVVMVLRFRVRLDGVLSETHKAFRVEGLV